MTPKHFRAEARAVRGLGQVQSRVLAGGLSRLRRALRPQHLLRAALDQADRGWHRLGGRDDAARCWSRPWRRAPIAPPFDVSEAMYRKIRCPVLVIHGDNDQIQPHARGKLVAEVTGAEFVTIPGGGHNPLGRYPGKVQRADQRFSRSPARHSGAEAGASAPRPSKSQEGALSLLADRPRARPPRHRHRARAAQAAPGPAGRLAGAGPGDAPARGQRRAHPSAERAARQRDRGTSSWSRASTICTASRRSAAWTRC